MKIFFLLLLLSIPASVRGSSKKSAPAKPAEPIFQPDKIPASMRACAKDEDCAAGLMGCWHWVPVNRKFLEPETGYIKGANVSCRASEEAGAKPDVGCRDKKCAETGTENCVKAQCWGHLGCNYYECTRKDGTTYTKFVP